MPFPDLSENDNTPCHREPVRRLVWRSPKVSKMLEEIATPVCALARNDIKTDTKGDISYGYDSGILP